MRMLLGGLPVIGFVINMSGEAKGNPYQGIVARNSFGLRSPFKTGDSERVPVPPAPLSEVRLTGITTLPGTPRVLLEIKDPRTGKTDCPPPLSNGEHYKSVTIIVIDPVNRTVRIKCDDVEKTLDFETDGIKASPPSPAAPAPPSSAAPTPRILLQHVE